VSEQTTTPDYQQLIGKKVLSLRPAYIYGGELTIGHMALIVEAIDEDGYGDVKVRQMEWRAVELTEEMLRTMYQKGIYKVVGVGLVFDYEPYGHRYKLLVNDTIRDVYENEIPF